jgi:hypothetical protein
LRSELVHFEVHTLRFVISRRCPNLIDFINLQFKKKLVISETLSDSVYELYWRTTACHEWTSYENQMKVKIKVCGSSGLLLKLKWMNSPREAKRGVSRLLIYAVNSVIVKVRITSCMSNIIFLFI